MQVHYFKVSDYNTVKLTQQFLKCHKQQKLLICSLYAISFINLLFNSHFWFTQIRTFFSGNFVLDPSHIYYHVSLVQLLIFPDSDAYEYLLFNFIFLSSFCFIRRWLRWSSSFSKKKENTRTFSKVLSQF